VEERSTVYLDAADIVKTFHAEIVKVRRGAEKSNGN
jgi:hypothetical protein